MFTLLKLLAFFNPFRLFTRRKTMTWRSKLHLFGLLVAAAGALNIHIMPDWLSSLLGKVTGQHIVSSSGSGNGGTSQRGLDYGGTHAGGYEQGGNPGGTTQLFAAFANLNLDQRQVRNLPDSSPSLTGGKPSTAPWRMLSQVVDGDSVVVDGRMVRLIGIDCPESSENTRMTGELKRIGATRQTEEMLALGRRAADFTRRLAQGKRCWLEYDGQTTDKYERILAYVHLEDGTNLNEALVYQGYAKVYLGANFRYLKRYIFLQGEAMNRGHGLWSGR